MNDNFESVHGGHGFLMEMRRVLERGPGPTIAIF
jgi:hypothetical protein